MTVKSVSEALAKIQRVGTLTLVITGRRTPWFRRPERQDDSFENIFEYRAADVVIVSYPKSGSTWLRFVLANLISEMFSSQKEVDFLNAQLLVPEISLHAKRNGVNFEVLPSPRVMRSHSLYNPRFPKVVYLLRDGRDVLVSYYYHFKKFHAFDGTLLDFIKSNVRKTEWDDHVNSWIFQITSLQNVCVIRYEHMLMNAFDEINKIVRFSGLSCTAESIRSAIEKSGFHKLQELEQRKGLGYMDQQNKDIPFIRQGKSGSWYESFGPEEKTYVKQQLGDALIRAGYESSYLW